MQAIEVANGVEVGMGELVKRLSKLDVNRLEKLRGHIDKVVAIKKAPTKAERESQLVKLIKQKIPASLLKYKNDLYDKLEDGMITPQEHHDLKTTLNYLEELAAERIWLMGELANLRKVGIEVIAQEFIRHKP